MGWSTILHRHPGQAKACEKARVQGPFEWDIGYPNQWCPLFASVSRMFIYIIYYIFIHFTPAFFSWFLCFAFWFPGPQLFFIFCFLAEYSSEWRVHEAAAHLGIDFPNRFVAMCLWQYEGHTHLETTCFLIFYGTNVIWIVLMLKEGPSPGPGTLWESFIY